MTDTEIDSALDVIFSTFDYLMSEGKFSTGDVLLSIEDPNTCDVAIAIGYLTATLAAKDKFLNRKAFAMKLYARLVRERSQDKADRLMAGLF